MSMTIVWPPLLSFLLPNPRPSHCNNVGRAAVSSDNVLARLFLEEEEDVRRDDFFTAEDFVRVEATRYVDLLYLSRL